MLTFEQANELNYGKTLHHSSRKNSDGTPMRVRKSGAVKVWKRTGDWRMPVKWGLYESGYIGTRDTASTNPDCADPANWSV